MQADQTPFRPEWWSISLRKYRPCDATYCLFPYDLLPPIDPAGFRGDFRPALVAEATARGVSLPSTFLAFMRDPEAHRRVPTCTACYFDLPPEMTPSPFGDGVHLIRFLNDQQWLLLWHLYLKPSGEHCLEAVRSGTMAQQAEHLKPRHARYRAVDIVIPCIVGEVV